MTTSSAEQILLLRYLRVVRHHDDSVIGESSEVGEKSRKDNHLAG